MVVVAVMRMMILVEVVAMMSFWVLMMVMVMVSYLVLNSMMMTVVEEVVGNLEMENSQGMVPFCALACELPAKKLHPSFICLAQTTEEP